MVVSKKHAQKLGAAALMAGFAITGAACDGDENTLVCGDIPANFYSLEDTYWDCELEEVGGDGNWGFEFQIFDDGTGTTDFTPEVTWEAAEDECAIVFTVQGEGDNEYVYTLSDIEVTGDGESMEVTMNVGYSGPETDGDYTATCDVGTIE